MIDRYAGTRGTAMIDPPAAAIARTSGETPRKRDRAQTRNVNQSRYLRS
ncbi:MAG: hypothetical protein ACKO01_00975 [Erythrobacter sp.]